MHIFVTGGSGVLGTELVPRLIARGHRVTVASRHPQPIAGADTAVIDLAAGTGLDAVGGHDTVVHLASDAVSPTTDTGGTRALLEAAQRHGIDHLVGISIVGVDDHPFPYYRRKLEGEAIIASGDVPWSLLRATQFHELIPRFLREMPAIGIVPVPIGLRIQPIDVADVAERLVEIIEAGPSGRVPDLGGPEVLPARRIVRDSLRAMRLRRLMVPLPLSGDLGRAFKDGRMLTPNRSNGIRWSEWVGALAPHRDRVGRLAIFSAFLFALTGIFMLVAPDVFHAEVAPFGEPNSHFVRDAATLLLPIVIGLWAAADRPAWRRPVFLIVAITNGAHLVNHIVDIGSTDPTWLGPANAVLLAVFELAVLWMWRESQPSGEPSAHPAQNLVRA